MEDSITSIFTGSEVEVLLLQSLLANEGIFGMIRDPYESGLSAGYFGGPAASVELLISDADLGRAQPIIAEFEANRAEGERDQ